MKRWEIVRLWRKVAAGYKAAETLEEQGISLEAAQIHYEQFYAQPYPERVREEMRPDL